MFKAHQLLTWFVNTGLFFVSFFFYFHHYNSISILLIQVLPHHLAARRTQGKDVCSEVGRDIQWVQGRPFFRTFPSFFKAEDKWEFRAGQHLPQHFRSRETTSSFSPHQE